MTCEEARPLLDAYFDSELDLVASLNMERHLSECAACSNDLRNLERLREELTPAVFNRIEPDAPEKESRYIRADPRQGRRAYRTTGGDVGGAQRITVHIR